MFLHFIYKLLYCEAIFTPVEPCELLSLSYFLACQKHCYNFIKLLFSGLIQHRLVIFLLDFKLCFYKVMHIYQVFWFCPIVRFLKNKIQPEDQHQFHFFNSFFFRKLVDLDKDPRNACEGREAFQRVHKWTRNVDLFEKDYIFIPVNYRCGNNYAFILGWEQENIPFFTAFQYEPRNTFCSLHWSLIVICHPGEVANFRGKVNVINFWF